MKQLLLQVIKTFNIFKKKYFNYIIILIVAAKSVTDYLYIMYSGEAAEALAEKYKVEKVENSYFFTQKRYDEMRRVQLDITQNFVEMRIV